MNRHFNLFEFFNNNEAPFYEDNLSRAFAICLKFDTVFLKSVFQIVLSEEQHERLFNTDFPNYQIDIDLQKKAQDLRGCNEIIAVACSVSDIDFSSIDKIKEGSTKDTVTDVSITIDDICIIFEFKRSSEDCSAQLKGQVFDIKDSEDLKVHYVDLNWHKIVMELLQVQSMQKLIQSTNPFTDSLIKFLNRKHPDWFPARSLANIPFPNSQIKDDPNKQHLNNRLNQIKEHVAKKLGTTTEDIGSRKAINIDWRWAQELHIFFEELEGQPFITVRLHPGDTKAQGWHLFKKGKDAIRWPGKIEGVVLDVAPYLKFSHFNSGILWHFVDKNSSTYINIFNYEFFRQYAGRYKKEKWSDFNLIMLEKIADWQSKDGFKKELLDTNRTYFDLAFGIRLRACIPYNICRNLDRNLESKGLINKLTEVIKGMKELIDYESKSA